MIAPRRIGLAGWLRIAVRLSAGRQIAEAEALLHSGDAGEPTDNLMPAPRPPPAESSPAIAVPAGADR